jgi:hypothetical protein
MSDNEIIEEFSFMTVNIMNKEKVCNERFFVDGVLPSIGQAVEMVYVGDSPDHPGMMRFQLRVVS